jgi:hypothetical protein
VRSQVVALGIAAALLVALGYTLGHRSSTVEKTAPLADAVVTRPSPLVDAPPAAQPGSQQDEAAAGESLESEYATAFVPLPYADDTNTLDGGSVVRVVLSRPALASLGMPVTDLGATDRIPADIVLSEDGVPQAIRLVSQASLDE